MRTYPTIEKIAAYAAKHGAKYDAIVDILNSDRDGRTIYDWVKVVAPEATASKALDVMHTLYIYVADI